MKLARTLLAACVIVALPVAVSAVEAKKTTDDAAAQKIKKGAKTSTYQGLTNVAGKMQDKRQAKPDNAVQTRLRANPALLRPAPANVEGRIQLIQAKLTPQGKARVDKEAAAVRAGTKSPQEAEASLRGSGINFGAMPIEDAVMLMFFLISEDARDDMRSMLDDMNKTRQRKDALRDAARSEKDTIDSMSDMTEQQQTRLQMYMDRRQKALETLSNLMKKSSDASSSLVQNMK